MFDIIISLRVEFSFLYLTSRRATRQQLGRGFLHVKSHVRRGSTFRFHLTSGLLSLLILIPPLEHRLRALGTISQEQLHGFVSSAPHALHRRQGRCSFLYSMFGRVW